MTFSIQMFEILWVTGKGSTDDGDLIVTEDIGGKVHVVGVSRVMTEVLRELHHSDSLRFCGQLI